MVLNTIAIPRNEVHHLELQMYMFFGKIPNSWHTNLLLLTIFKQVQLVKGILTTS